MTPDPITTRLDFARANTMECAKIALQYFQTPEARPDHKSDGSPVTIADRAIETELRKRIEHHFPDDTIRGEEFPTKEGSTDFEWIIDPIDGTVSFVQGVPLFGTMLACLHKGTPTIGAIAIPCLDEMVIAATGHGATHIRAGHPDTPCNVTTNAPLSSALVVTTTPDSFRDRNALHIHDTLAQSARSLRGWSDCYAFVLLATARIDAVIEPVVSIWDIASVPPIITEAGGAWSDLKGNHALDTGHFLACAAPLHPELLRITKAIDT